MMHAMQGVTRYRLRLIGVISESTCGNAIVVIAFLWTVYLLSLGRLPPALTGTSVLVTIVCVVIILRRVAVLQRILKKGIEVQGTFVGIELDRRRVAKCVNYSYSYEGYKYAAQSAPIRRKTKYEPGDALPVIISGSKPEKSLIRDMYCRERKQRA